MQSSPDAREVKVKVKVKVKEVKVSTEACRDPETNLTDRTKDRTREDEHHRTTGSETAIPMGFQTATGAGRLTETVDHRITGALRAGGHQAETGTKTKTETEAVQTVRGPGGARANTKATKGKESKTVKDTGVTIVTPSITLRTIQVARITKIRTEEGLTMLEPKLPNLFALQCL